MFELLERLFPICRSITGEGVRRTFDVLKEIIPIITYEVPSGTQCFDWEVPPEWNIKDAYILDPDGRKIVDFKNNNLHVVSYSIPIDATVTLEELKKHLHFLPEMPDAIPYIASYYNKDWGFCLSYNQFKKLTPGNYKVKIDSTLETGSLTYGDLVIRGNSDKEILFSTYICHPSMANNELSGPVILTYLAKWLMQKKDLRYTYRFIFVPETIGSIVYCARNESILRDKCISGLVITCAGDPGPFSYLSTPYENRLVDFVTKRVLVQNSNNVKFYGYRDRGSDERQYASPNLRLPVGTFMRTRFGEFQEYHTSMDNLNFVKSESLNESLQMLMKITDEFEKMNLFQSKITCEPQLGKRGLYTNKVVKNYPSWILLIKDICSYSDGNRDVKELANFLNAPEEHVLKISNELVAHGILEKI